MRTGSPLAAMCASLPSADGFENDTHPRDGTPENAREGFQGIRLEVLVTRERHRLRVTGLTESGVPPVLLTALDLGHDRRSSYLHGHRLLPWIAPYSNDQDRFSSISTFSSRCPKLSHLSLSHR